MPTFPPLTHTHTESLSHTSNHPQPASNHPSPDGGPRARTPALGPARHRGRSPLPLRRHPQAFAPARLLEAGMWACMHLCVCRFMCIFGVCVCARVVTGLLPPVQLLVEAGTNVECRPVALSRVVLYVVRCAWPLCLRLCMMADRQCTRGRKHADLREGGHPEAVPAVRGRAALEQAEEEGRRCVALLCELVEVCGLICREACLCSLHASDAPTIILYPGCSAKEKKLATFFVGFIFFFPLQSRCSAF